MRRTLSILVLGAIGVLWAAGACWAVQQTMNSADQSSNGSIIETSKLKGMTIYNQADRTVKLGSIENLLISAHTGRVLYAALDTGTGGNIVAVPWKAFQVAIIDNQQRLTLNKTVSDLAKAPTIDVARMPDFSKSDWTDAVDSFYGVQTPVEHEDVGGLTANQLILPCDRLADLNVYNRANIETKLGNVDNLLINTNSGELLYALVDTGLGGKNILVPWQAFHFQKAGGKDQYWLTLSKTPAELENAPSVDSGQVATLASDEKMQQTVANFFGVRTVARPKQ